MGLKSYLPGLAALFAVFTEVMPGMEKYVQLLPTPNVAWGSSIADTQSLKTASNPKISQPLCDLLTSDFQALADFTESLNGFGITSQKFHELFWDGATQSLLFYQRSQRANRNVLKRMRHTDLWTHRDLGHPLQLPKADLTDTSRAFTALGHFSGEWHGIWQSNEVHHLWLPVRRYQEVLSDQYGLVGFQSCFTGDGFGWNYVVEGRDSVLILGFVYHFDDQGTITSENPHYAQLNTNNQLTWVSDSHIYHEFVCDDLVCAEKRHYVITGAVYKKQTEATAIRDGFQAIYLSTNQDLPVFSSLTIRSLSRFRSIITRKIASVLHRLASKVMSIR